MDEKVRFRDVTGKNEVTTEVMRRKDDAILLQQDKDFFRNM